MASCVPALAPFPLGPILDLRHLWFFWQSCFCVFWFKTCEGHFNYQHRFMEFIWHLPEKLVFPSKMNVDLKFVFRSIVQVYQRYFNIHSYVSLIRWFCSLSWWGSLQVQILRDIWRKRWILICVTKNKAKLQGSGDPQGNSAWGPISASSSPDSLPLLHQGR